MELYDPRMLFNCYSHARTKPLLPSYSYVSSRSVFTYSKNLKALCIPQGDERTKLLGTNEKRSNKNNNNVAHYIVLRDIKLH